MSRRQADRCIREGRIRVNDHGVDQISIQVDPEKDTVLLDGSAILPRPRGLYIVLNKPAGCLVTSSDPQGRPTVYDLVAHLPGRVFSVGRLDRETEGVLLLTDDGPLAQRLTHPRHNVIKEYLAQVAGDIGSADVKRLLLGIPLEDGVARARGVRLLTHNIQQSEISLQMITGKKRQVRRMCAAIGHPVIRLRRTAFAGLTAADLRPGQWRHLSQEEVRRIRADVGLTTFSAEGTGASSEVDHR